MELNTPIDVVVICASGKGVRLTPLTKYIPKFLVNPDNFNILTHIVKYWEPYTKNIVVIVEEKYNTITDYYLKMLSVPYKIINVNIDTQGNAYTLYKALNNDYEHKRLLITWCDIFPSISIPKSVFNNTVIFTHGNQCRYSYKNNIIEEKEDGNIIGIYYFNDFVSMKYDEESNDIINVMPKYYSSFDSYEITELIDVGDMEKLLAYENKNKSEYETRYYNKITEVEHDRLKKESAHPIGNEIIRGEINFYKTIQQYTLSCFPKIYEIGEHHFIMEKINGVVLKTLNVELYIELFIETLKTLHNTSTIQVPKETILSDLKYEFNIKIKEHTKDIKPLSNNFNQIRKINGISILHRDIDYIIDDLYKRIENSLISHDREIYEYSLIHADSHFSNTMVESNRIVFIDPYGRFGHSMVHGSVYFDYCLILFSLTGFDEFSASKKYHFDIEDDNIVLNIMVQDLEKYKPFFLKYDINWNTCMCMCILHWIKFTFYTSNHILKSVASYYHGMYLYHKYIL
jgi:choline kinase